MNQEEQKFQARIPAATSRPGFTLVELMLSLAMVLILIIGINYVFRSATDAVGAGQALNTINRDAQSSQPILFDDLRNVSKNPPCFIIASQLITQFLNADDAKTGFDPTIMNTDNAGGVTTGNVINGSIVNIGNANLATTAAHLSAAILNSRNHEQSLLKFFAHSAYPRRSGNDGSFAGLETANDAFIEIGAAALPTNDLTAFYGPSSAPTAAGSFLLSNGQTLIGVPRIGAYASDWVLARRVTLLKDGSGALPTFVSTGDVYYPIAGPPPPLPAGLGGATFGANMSPLSYGSLDSTSPSNASTEFQTSRYDLAGVTPEQFDRIINNAILAWQVLGYVGPPKSTPASLWWNPLVYAVPFAQHGPTQPQYVSLAGPPYVAPYLNSLPVYQFPVTDPGLLLDRPQCNPSVQAPLNAAALAEMAPYFLQHCSQFVVEYSGDYLQQDPASGNLKGIGPDGQIDFYFDANNNKRIRWYGMPRSSTGTPHSDGLGTLPANNVLIRGYDVRTDKVLAGTATSTGIPINFFTDVIPLRDYYSMWFNSLNNVTIIYSPPWEVDVNFDPTHDYGSYNAYVPARYLAGGNGIAFNDPNNPPRYVAAWHDDMPAMIRILIKVDDPNNKIKDGPWYEYVFRLK